MVFPPRTQRTRQTVANDDDDDDGVALAENSPTNRKTPLRKKRHHARIRAPKWQMKRHHQKRPEAKTPPRKSSDVDADVADAGGVANGARIDPEKAPADRRRLRTISERDWRGMA